MAVYHLIAVSLAFQSLCVHAETQCSKAAEPLDSSGLLQARTSFEVGGNDDGNDDGELQAVDATNVSPPDETANALKAGGLKAGGAQTTQDKLDALNKVAGDQTPADAEHNGDLFTSDGIAKITGSHAEDSGCGHAADPHDCFQGDMQAAGIKQMLLFQEIANGTKPQVAAGKPWDDKKVKYCFAADLDLNIKHLMMLAFDQMKSAVPCMSFEDVGNSGGHLSYDADHDKECDSAPAIFIQSRKDEGCWSYVGQLTPPILTWGRGMLKAQLFNLQPVGCEVLGIAIHELGHAVGMAHEQARPDREKFVKVHWKNIQSGMENNFKLNDKGYTGLDYDYESLMHYASHDFSINGKATLTSTDGLHDSTIGQRVGLSQHDADQLGAMYSCTASKVDGKTGCKDSDAMCAGLKACSKAEHAKKCCGCGGGTTYRCWSGSECKKPATLPVASEKACILDRTADFGGAYPCVTQNSCKHTVRIKCPAHPSYYFDYAPGGCCQLPPWGKTICGDTKCTFTKP